MVIGTPATRVRDPKVSEARLRLYEQIATRLKDEIGVNGYLGLRSVRDDFTSWAPWTITLPMWISAHNALNHNDEEFKQLLSATILALRKVLNREEAAVPDQLFGDLSEDVDVTLHAA